MELGDEVTGSRCRYDFCVRADVRITNGHVMMRTSLLRLSNEQALALLR